MRQKNKSLVHSSGMRGNEPMPEKRADDEAREGETGLEEGSSEQQDSDDLGTTVAEHIHEDQDTGHYHLNLSTLADALGKKKAGGAHDK